MSSIRKHFFFPLRNRTPDSDDFSTRKGSYKLTLQNEFTLRINQLIDRVSEMRVIAKTRKRIHELSIENESRRNDTPTYGI